MTERKGRAEHTNARFIEPMGTYQDPRSEPFRVYVIPVLKRIACAELMRKTGAKGRHMFAVRNGYRNPSVALRKVLIEVAAKYARRALPERVAGDMDACAAFTKCAPSSPCHTEGDLNGAGISASESLPGRGIPTREIQTTA